MSWILYHTESEKYASQAEIELRKGNVPLAQSLYYRAAEEEKKAFDHLDHTKTRTLEIMAVSMGSLWYKARDYVMAEKTVRDCLDLLDLLDFASNQLRSLLQTIQRENVTEPMDCLNPNL